MLSHKEQIGRLDRRITILQATTEKDDYNADVETWSTFKTVWAEVVDSAGAEVVQADQPTAVRTTTFTIRWIEGVTETMRVVFDGQLYNVVSIQRPDRKRTLILKTELLDEEPEETGGGFSATAFSNGFRIHG